MKKLLLLTAVVAAGVIVDAPLRAEDQSAAPAPASAAPVETTAPSASSEMSAAPVAESKAIPPDSEWVHPTK